MHFVEENPEKFQPKKGTLASSEVSLLPKLITKDELAERSELYRKTKEERKELKKMKLNVDPNAAAKAFTDYAKENKIGDLGNVTIYFM